MDPQDKIELEDYIERKVNALMDRDRDFLKWAVDRTLKIGAFLIVAIGAVAGYLGYKQFNDINTEVHEQEFKQISELVRTINPNSELSFQLRTEAARYAVMSRMNFLTAIYHCKSDNSSLNCAFGYNRTFGGDLSGLKLSADEAVAIFNTFVNQPSDNLKKSSDFLMENALVVLQVFADPGTREDLGNSLSRMIFLNTTRKDESGKSYEDEAWINDKELETKIVRALYYLGHFHNRSALQYIRTTDWQKLNGESVQIAIINYIGAAYSTADVGDVDQGVISLLKGFLANSPADGNHPTTDSERIAAAEVLDGLGRGSDTDIANLVTSHCNSWSAYEFAELGSKLVIVTGFVANDASATPFEQSVIECIARRSSSLAVAELGNNYVRSPNGEGWDSEAVIFSVKGAHKRAAQPGTLLGWLSSNFVPKLADVAKKKTLSDQKAGMLWCTNFLSMQKSGPLSATNTPTTGGDLGYAVVMGVTGGDNSPALVAIDENGRPIFSVRKTAVLVAPGNGNGVAWRVSKDLGATWVAASRLDGLGPSTAFDLYKWNGTKFESLSN